MTGRLGTAGRAVRDLGPLAWICLAWLGLMAVVAAGADVLPFADPLRGDFDALEEPPGAEHLLGTDANGRDVLARVAHGAQVSFIVGFGSTTIGLVLGTGLGVVAGYVRGWFDQLVSIVVDSFLAFPALVLVLVVTNFLGPTVRNITVTIGLLTVPVFARLARAATVTIVQRDDVRAAHLIGVPTRRVLAVDVLPNVLVSTVSYALIAVSGAMVAESALGFLDIGIAPPEPTWGNIISAGRRSFDGAPHIVFVPAMVLFLTVLSLNLLGDQVRAATDARESAL